MPTSGHLWNDVYKGLVQGLVYSWCSMCVPSSLPQAGVSPTLTRMTWEGLDALLTSSLGSQSQNAPGARQVPGIKKAVLGKFWPSTEKLPSWCHYIMLETCRKTFFFFLMWTILKAFIENLLQYCFCLMFWFFGHEVCPILAPQPGIDPALPALDSEILMTGLWGKSPKALCYTHTHTHTQNF